MSHYFIYPTGELDFTQGSLKIIEEGDSLEFVKVETYSEELRMFAEGELHCTCPSIFKPKCKSNRTGKHLSGIKVALLLSPELNFMTRNVLNYASSKVDFQRFSNWMMVSSFHDIDKLNVDSLNCENILLGYDAYEPNLEISLFYVLTWDAYQAGYPQDISTYNLVCAERHRVLIHAACAYKSRRNKLRSSKPGKFSS